MFRKKSHDLTIELRHLKFKARKIESQRIVYSDLTFSKKNIMKETKVGK